MGVAVGMGVGCGVGVAVGTGDGVAMGVAVPVGVGVAVSVRVALAVAVGTDVDVAVGLGRIFATGEGLGSSEHPARSMARSIAPGSSALIAMDFGTFAPLAQRRMNAWTLRRP